MGQEGYISQKTAGRVNAISGDAVELQWRGTVGVYTGGERQKTMDRLGDAVVQYDNSSKRDNI